jgi:hypothetical protein
MKTFLGYLTLVAFTAGLTAALVSFLAQLLPIDEFNRYIMVHVSVICASILVGRDFWQAQRTKNLDQSVRNLKS